MCAAVFINQIFTGLTALRYYDTEIGWIGDHVQADYALLRALMENLNDFITIDEDDNELRLRINRLFKSKLFLVNHYTSLR